MAFSSQLLNLCRESGCLSRQGPGGKQGGPALRGLGVWGGSPFTVGGCAGVCVCARTCTHACVRVCVCLLEGDTGNSGGL